MVGGGEVERQEAELCSEKLWGLLHTLSLFLLEPKSWQSGEEGPEPLTSETSMLNSQGDDPK